MVPLYFYNSSVCVTKTLLSLFFVFAGDLHLPSPIPITGPQHIPNSPEKESNDKFSLPHPTSLHRFQRTPIQTLGATAAPSGNPAMPPSGNPGMPPSGNPAIPQYQVRPALLETPPEWQRFGPGVNGPMPPRTSHNLRPPLGFPRHPYVRPPGPANQFFQRPQFGFRNQVHKIQWGSE